MELWIARDKDGCLYLYERDDAAEKDLACTGDGNDGVGDLAARQRFRDRKGLVFLLNKAYNAHETSPPSISSILRPAAESGIFFR